MKHDIAITGFGLVFPGAANKEEFWQRLTEAKDLSQEIPEGRWVLDPKSCCHNPAGPDEVRCTRGYFVNAKLSHEGLPADIPWDELDPVFWLPINAAREALAHTSVKKERTGLILADIVLPTDKASELSEAVLGKAFEKRLLEKIPSLSESDQVPLPNSLNKGSVGLCAGLTAYSFGLEGGAYTLDAACASSLAAISLACDELNSGRADAMLAGGVSRPSCLYTQMGFSALKALSPSGKCSPFDAKADGLMVGEGCGIAVLKRLEDAIADGDKIYAVIKGCGMSNDIGGSLLAPDSEGQLRSLRAAYEDAGLSPRDIDWIECHGTGTPVGDKVEFESLCSLWKSAKPAAGTAPADGKCCLTSVKSMIGHLLTAANTAGLFRILLSLEHSQITSQVNYTQPGLPIEQSPFTVPTHSYDWPRRTKNTPRRAAVSGFGFGGINAHIIIEEWDPQICPAHACAESSPASNAAPSANACPAGTDMPADNASPADAGSQADNVPIAIVGMAATTGFAKNIGELRKAIFSGEFGVSEANAAKAEASASNGADESGSAKGLRYTDSKRQDASIVTIDKVEVPIGKFKIPPADIPSILTQQSLMLNVASEALEDAEIDCSLPAPKAAAIIGLGFDPKASGFHLRWALANKVKKWAKELNLTDEEARNWLKELRDEINPALDAARTLGALGSISPSRIAREFRFGGASFAVSGEEASGIRAIEISVRALQKGDLDLALAGAIDMGIDPRYLAGAATGSASPHGTPALHEGAAALVLKRLDDALKDGSKIYGIIKGIGSSSGTAPGQNAASLCRNSAKKACADAGISPASVSFLESSERFEGAASASLDVFAEGDIPCALNSSPIRAGSLGGLLSLIKTALCLHSRALPPQKDFESLPAELAGFADTRFHICKKPSHWYRDRIKGPRLAAVSCATDDGQHMHVILEQGEEVAAADRILDDPTAVFPVFGNNADELIDGLDALKELAETHTGTLDGAARLWWQKRSSHDKLCLAIAADNIAELLEKTEKAQEHLFNSPEKPYSLYGIFYAPEPLAYSGRTAFVYPGSGSHFLGMGQEIAFRFPSILQRQDMENECLLQQSMARWFDPYELLWDKDWRQRATDALSADTHKRMFGQVSFGSIVTDILLKLGLKPNAAIGYSLGESAALFSLRAWPERDMMLRRMEASPLFREYLSGKCLSIRKAWNIPDDKPVNWAAAMILKPQEAVREAMKQVPETRMLIINTDDECVVGGTLEAVKKLNKLLGVRPIIIQGVDTVHCDALAPVADDYEAMHNLPTVPPPGITFYSGNAAKAYDLTAEAIAHSIVSHGVHGFDYTKVIRQAWEDGIRIFIEPGPGSSCARMINKILQDKPHCAVSASMRGYSEITTLMHMLAAILAQGLRPNLGVLYEEEETPDKTCEQNVIEVATCVKMRKPTLPERKPQVIAAPAPLPAAVPVPRPAAAAPAPQPVTAAPAPPLATAAPAPAYSAPAAVPAAAAPAPSPCCAAAVASQYAAQPGMPNISADTLTAKMASAAVASYQAHESWMRFANYGVIAMGELLSRQTQIMASCLSQGIEIPYMPSPFGASNILESALGTETSASALQNFAPAITADYTASAASAVTAAATGISASSAAASASTMMIHGSPTDASTGYVRGFKPSLAPAGQEVWMNREHCLQFATGRIGDVLGPKFAEIDNHPTRVRLPDEPLMLVDRIISIEGEPLSLGKGRLVTEHDVVPGMWYLDGGRAPVFLSVEAGQADLFLSGWLGIDLVTKGERVYRLLDATVSFHRGLPVPGETIRYDIRIDRFVHQGSTWLFFFEYEATINGQTFLTMRNGCAGFFTHQEIRENRGLVLTEAELAPKQGKRLTGAEPLVSLQASSYAEPQVEALRRGDLETCFGSAFAGLALNTPVRLPDGLLRLIHRIPVCDPNGGRWSLGMVIGEADVHPDDWFLTCHFVDDMVMPGTLMYECCAHALRFLLTSLGWVGENDRIAYEPVPGVHASLKCRGPVLQTTKIVDYQVEIKEIGYKPEPYVIADAIMYADGKRIVGFEDISMQMTGITGDELKKLWATRNSAAATHVAATPSTASQAAPAQAVATPSLPATSIAPDAAAIPQGLIPANLEPGVTPADPQGESMPSAHGDPIKPALYDSNSLLQFARGLPSLAYGPHFAKFDTSFIARLPGPPYQFVDRITSCDHPFMHMGPGGWVEAQYEVPADAWYFRANRQNTMPFCVLLEIPLQVCGWLSAYAGSSATSDKELHYRNLGGTATLYEEITPKTGVLTIRVRMTKASSAGGLIIQAFDMWMGQNGRTIYEGDTTFGFFPPESLANQVGILNTESRSWKPDRPGRELPVNIEHPIVPDDQEVTPCPSLALPGKALMMLDDMQIIAEGGPHNLGYVCGTKTVDPGEWFFKAHFFQDPVIPGSLGLESFLQLLKGAAIDRWPQYASTRSFECILTGEPHTWVYRGQVVPKNNKVTVEAYITEIRDGEEPVIKADGFLRVDGRTVYEMKDFGLRLRKN